jgi:hypothetical protein
VLENVGALTTDILCTGGVFDHRCCRCLPIQAITPASENGRNYWLAERVTIQTTSAKQFVTSVERSDEGNASTPIHLGVSVCRTPASLACALRSIEPKQAIRVEIARQGVRALRPTGPAGPELHLAEPSSDGPTRDDHLDFAPWHAPQEKTPANSGKARYSPNENRCCCSGSSAHCCYGRQNARSTLDC